MEKRTLVRLCEEVHAEVAKIKYRTSMTVGDLKKYIAHIPSDTPICMQCADSYTGYNVCGYALDAIYKRGKGLFFSNDECNAQTLITVNDRGRRVWSRKPLKPHYDEQRRPS